eukprot:CAMPEP_0113907764 /NCGR_PEP_ID=MMETSP0780_2-20120614/25704_1 /TAXON_ID=652834 /ORGANISM="Palpitomonas bilix" /LENGTH=535 /DNA_ID=CAMNT_0000902951 /DNA_START=72 /DNA_END=1679 /DNA_ORIENTATION=+ /assembly_acc=CAM_ASM_000599
MAFSGEAAFNFPSADLPGDHVPEISRPIGFIINGDDLGYSAERDAGLIEAYLNGGMTSFSLLVNGATAASAVERLRQAIRERDEGEYESTAILPIGLHINLTEGKPCAPASRVQTLLRREEQDEEADLEAPRRRRKDPSKRKRKRRRKEPAKKKLKKLYFRGKYGLRKAIEEDLVEDREVHIEVMAQLRRFVQLTGQAPTHFDGHNHCHILPVVREVVAQIFANEIQVSLAPDPPLPPMEGEGDGEGGEYVDGLDEDGMHELSQDGEGEVGVPVGVDDLSSDGSEEEERQLGGELVRGGILEHEDGEDERDVMGMHHGIPSTEEAHEEVQERHDERQEDGQERHEDAQVPFGQARAEATDAAEMFSFRCSKTRVPEDHSLAYTTWVSLASMPFLATVSDNAARSRDVFSSAGISFPRRFLGLSLTGADLTMDRFERCLRTSLRAEEGEVQQSVQAVQDEKESFSYVVEYMVHPGYVGTVTGGCGHPDGADEFNRSTGREIELNFIMSHEFRSKVETYNLKLCSFLDLPAPTPVQV